MPSPRTAGPSGIMDIEEFKSSISGDAAPAGLSAALEALWWDAKGDWDRAHNLAQSQKDEAGAWVHAYLHRVEGDESNAGYWYRRAGRDHSTVELATEWREIAIELLKREET